MIKVSWHPYDRPILFPYSRLCLVESVANPPRFQQQQPTYHQISVAEQTTKGLARPQDCRYLDIYIRCVCPGYIRAYVCSCSRTFLTKLQELLSSRLRGQSRYLGFPSFPFTVLRRFPDCSPSVVSCGLVTAPGMNPAERDETNTEKEMEENENERTDGTRTPCRVRKSGRAALATANCYRCSSVGDIKRELEPNLCRRACLMASLYGIERDGGRVPETP